MFKIAVVVGGTNVKCALFKDNRIILSLGRPTCPEKGKKFMIKNILGMISDVKGGRRIKGIGVGSPGIIDSERGIVVKCSKLEWKNLPLKKIIKDEFKTNVVIENDAKCAALGVLKKTKAKDFVLLTLGTGLGGAVIIRGKLYKGMGNAGEFGHWTMERGGIKCKCGNMGCLEEYACKRGFERLALKYFGRKLSPLDLEKLARKGDKMAKRIYQEAGEWLGIGLANIANAFNPETIYFTGKISRAGKLLLGPARNEMEKRCYVKTPKLKICDEDAELLGAASLIK